jgi:Ser/Thr protein kinase RdoA (MazF antagonist)
MFRSKGVPELANRFGLDLSGLSVIQGDRNLVFECEQNNIPIVFKVMSSRRSQHDLLLGEIDWMAHLSAHGVAVPEPFRSGSGQLVESVTVEGWTLSACCLEKVSGTLWQDSPDSDQYISPVGRLAGKMHRVSRDYVPPSRGARRPQWNEAPWFASPEAAFHPSMPRIIERCRELRSALEQLAREEGYGLVHDDLHGKNVMIAEGQPLAIDFEVSQYTWYVSEIASALFFHLWKTPQSEDGELKAQACEFVSRFLEGYLDEHSLHGRWIALLPLFLKVRELSMFASSSLAQEDFEQKGRQDADFCWMKKNIEEDVPYVALDVAGLI